MLKAFSSPQQVQAKVNGQILFLGENLTMAGTGDPRSFIALTQWQGAASISFSSSSSAAGVVSASSGVEQFFERDVVHAFLGGRGDLHDERILVAVVLEHVVVDFGQNSVNKTFT